MPLKLFPNVYSAGIVPADWKPKKGGMVKYPVKNQAVFKILQELFQGNGKK
jgi:hypothetical protein